MKQEMIDVLDEFGNKTGEVKEKTEIKADRDFHRIASVCIINGNNEILIHQRKEDKFVYPNLWSCFIRGHVMSGEDSLSAAIRELKEEIGIDVNINELEYIYTLKDENESVDENFSRNMFYDNYLLRKNINIQDIVIEKEELKDIKFIHYKKIQEILLDKERKKEFVPNEKDYTIVLNIIDERYS